MQVWDREKIVLIPDHYIFTTDERANRNVDILRDFAHEQDIKYFYDITDRSNFRVCVGSYLFLDTVIRRSILSRMLSSFVLMLSLQDRAF